MTPLFRRWAALCIKFFLPILAFSSVITPAPLLAFSEQVITVQNPLHQSKRGTGSKTRERLLDSERTSRELEVLDREKYRQGIFAAIEAGSISELIRIYRKDVAVYGKFGMTPLYFAAHKGNIGLVDYLLLEGEDANQQNTHRFRTRSQGQRRKSRQAISGARDVFRDQLVDAGGFTLDIFASGIYDRLGKPRASKRKSEVAKKIDSESRPHFSEILSEGGIRGSVKITNGTPIFAIVNKEEIGDTEMELADLLLRYGANVTATNAYKQTPIDILEARLEHLAEGMALLAPRCKHSFSTARDLYRQAIVDTELRRRLFPIWFMFADSHTTARLIESECPKADDEKRIPHVAFFDGFAKWELDGVLPMPRDAFDRYTRIKEHLPEKTRFRMLLRYLYLYGKNARAETPSTDLNLLNASLHELHKQSPSSVAKAIFAVHRELFLSVSPREIALKYARNDASPKLQELLRRIDQLSSFVSYTIIMSEHRDAYWHFWYHVADRLLRLNDLFGVSCIVSGLRSVSVTRLLGDTPIALPDLQLYKTYVHLKQEALRNGAVIPCIYHEGTRFQGQIERLLLEPEHLFTPDAETDFPQLVDAFMEDMSHMQELLKPMKVNAGQSLTELFRHLPISQANGLAAELLSLRIEKQEQPDKRIAMIDEFKPAEYWDTHDLWNWLGRERLERFTPLLIENGITNGGSFIEKMAIARSPRFRELGNQEMQAVFGVYENVCRENNTEALGSCSQVEPFPVNLFQNPKSSFQWIMWLRNNDLDDAIPILIAQRIDTFHAFIDNELKVGALHRDIKNLKDHHLEKLSHLKDIFLHLNDRPDDVSAWRRSDKEAWLLQHGLSHLLPVIERDGVKKADHFLAYVYLLWKFKFGFLRELGLSDVWTRALAEVGDATLFRKFIEDAREPPSFIRKRDQTSRLFFIRLLLSIGAQDSLPLFYREGIRTTRKLKALLHPRDQTSNDDESGELELNTEVFTLGKFGLSEEQITALLPYLQ